MSPARNSVAAAIGGRWAVSLRLFILAAPIAILSNLIFARALTAAQVGIALGISVASYAVMGGVLWLADLTVLRLRRVRPVAPLLVVAVGAVSGLARSAVGWGLGVWLGVADASGVSLGTRLASGVLLGACLIPLGAYVLARVDGFREDRRRLVAEMSALHKVTLLEGVEAMVIDDLLGVEADRAMLVGAAEEVREIARRLGRDGSQSMRAEARRRLNGVAQDVVRPMSHRLAGAGREVDIPRVKWGSIIDTSLRVNPFPVLWVCMLWTVSAWPGEWARMGLWPSIAHTAGTLLLFAVTFGVGAAVIRRHPRARYVTFIAVVAVDVVVGAVLTKLVVPDAPGSMMATGAIVTAIWLPVLILAVSIAQTSLQEADAIIARLREDVAVAEVDLFAARTLVAESRRAFAVYLHGDIQPRLLAAALTVESAGGADEAASTLQDLATSMLSLPASAHPADWIEGLAHLQDRWRGIVEIVLMESFGACVPRHTQQALEAVDEAVANAFRHGRAGRVEVVWACRDDFLEVQVMDDGHVVSSGPPGMGSALFGAVSVGGWERVPSREGHGATLRMRVAR